MRPKSEWGKNLGEKWKHCWFCDQKWLRAILHFDSGSVEPTVGETLTGVTSGDTGVVTGSDLILGTYAGGDAVGVVKMSTPTGYHSIQRTIFEDDEAINGSTGGSNMLTANKAGAVLQQGIIYPKKDMIKYKGKWMCRWHADWYIKSKVREENRMNLAELERERGKE